MRQDCSPYLIREDGSASPLKRQPFDKRLISEDWLQKTLHRSPNLLPIKELDVAYGPLVSIGREIRAIDNLFISPNGRIVLVETKLWRNPEATRQVVAQILDYAKVLSSMSYEELEQAIKQVIPSEMGNNSLYQYVHNVFPEETGAESDFIDEVSQTLREGRFMLLVVGDGIRENVEDLLALIHRFPEMLFTFALVEMQLFKAECMDGILVVPRVVAHSTEIIRAVVKVEGGAHATISVSVPEEPREPTGKRLTLSESEFFDALPDSDTKLLYRDLLNFAHDLGAELSWGAISVAARIADPGGTNQFLSIFNLVKNGEIYTWGLNSTLEKLGIDPAIAQDFASQLAGLSPRVSVVPKYTTLRPYLKSNDIYDQVDTFKAIVSAAVERIREASAAKQLQHNAD